MTCSSVKETESALYYLQSRYYDPVLGRFINADALISTGHGILGNHMFAYCNNNPTLFVDITGHSLKPTTVRISDMSGFSAPRQGTISSDDWSYYDKYNQSVAELGNALENTMQKWNDSKAGQGADALYQIHSGISHIEKGYGFLMIPIPTTGDDLVGIGFITYGVLEFAGGITKLIIWVVEE